MDKVLVRFSDDRGRMRETVFETESRETLRRDLQGRGCFILSEVVLEKTLTEHLNALNPFYGRISLSELIEFAQLLRTLVRAGLPLKDALDVLLDESVEGPMTRALSQIRDDITEGISFSAALARHPRVFPEMFVKTVVAGEKSGALEEVFARLIIYYQRTAEIRRKLIGALVYPAILVMVSAGAISYLIVKVVPEFSDLFRSMDIPLPTYTQIVLGLASFLGDWLPLILIAAVGGGFLLARYHRTPHGRVFFDRVKLRLPLIGMLEMKHSFSQFSRTLSTLIDGGIPILESLDVVVGSLDNKEMARRLTDLSRDIQGGASFARALKSVPGMPATMIKVVQVGEESGNLGEMLSGIADHYDEEISALTGVLTALIEPLLFLGIAGTVGAIIIALLLPILTAASNIR
jgi:type II secretory pathway component PulF